MKPKLQRYFQLEIYKATLAEKDKNWEQCYEHLSRAHIIGQKSIKAHFVSHWLMFKVGFKSRNFKEIIGQIPRMLAAIIFSKLWVPEGNTGRANVSAFKPMPIPKDLTNLLKKYQ